MRFLISIVILLSSVKTIAQNWAVVSPEKFSDFVLNVMVDSIHNKLISSGRFTNKVGNLNIRGVASWNGIKWDSLAGGINTYDEILNPNNPDGFLATCIPYNGKLLTGGYFSSVGNVNTAGLALWDGTKWDSLPKRAFRHSQSEVIKGFQKKGNLLYIIGQFDTIAGLPTNGIATWDGSNYNSILLPVNSGFQGISSIIEYQNEIYITGGTFINNLADILRYNGSSWVSTTGGGLLGAYAGASNLTVYNNELYASGHFTKAEGNSGDNIMKWDGSQWKDVGFGNTPAFEIIYKTLVYKNKLWVFGSFTKAANAFAGNVAVYDGTSWCGVKDTLDNTILSAAVYNDTIYIGGGFWKANADSIPYMAKLKNPDLFNQCVNVVGVHELSSNSPVTVYPNPTPSILNISDEQNQLQQAIIYIKNPLEQIVYSSPFSNQIDISALSAGIYFLTIEDKSNKKTVKVIKND